MKLNKFNPYLLNIDDWNNSLFGLDNLSIDFSLSVLSKRMFNSRYKLPQYYTLITNPYIRHQYSIYVKSLVDKSYLKSELMNLDRIPIIENLCRNALVVLDKYFIELIKNGEHKNQERLVRIKRSYPVYSLRIDNFNRLVFMPIHHNKQIILDRLMFHYDDEIKGSKDEALKSDLVQLFNNAQYSNYPEFKSLDKRIEELYIKSNPLK